MNGQVLISALVRTLLWVLIVTAFTACFDFSGYTFFAFKIANLRNKSMLFVLMFSTGTEVGKV